MRVVLRAGERNGEKNGLVSAWGRSGVIMLFILKGDHMKLTIFAPCRCGGQVVINQILAKKSDL